MVESTFYSKEKFFDALWEIEASGDLYPSDGDGGKSIGPFQIKIEYYQDSNKDKKEGYENVRKMEYAKICVDNYMKRYSDGKWSDSMSIDDVERCARMHNGGPSGYKRTATEGYWRKFKQIIEK